MNIEEAIKIAEIDASYKMKRIWKKDGAGNDKLYLCAWASEDSVAFYKKNGCVPAIEINEELWSEDRNNIQLEVEV